MMCMQLSAYDSNKFIIKGLLMYISYWVAPLSRPFLSGSHQLIMILLLDFDT